MDPDPVREDYNLCSAERKAVLKDLNTHLNGNQVSPAFWAACQLADMENLKELCTTKVGLLMSASGGSFQIMSQCRSSSR